MFFAKQSKSEGHSIILLKIHLENESGKHYFSLDSAQFTLYPDEQEILLQAGLITNVIDVKEEGEMTVFELTTSEKLINQKFFGVPVDWYSYLSVMSFFLNRTIYQVLAYA